MGSDRFPTASRRDVLKAGGVLGLGVFGAQGVSSVASADGALGDASDVPASAWPQFGRTVGNAGATDVDLTSSERPFLRKRWTAEEDGGLPAQPVVANGTVFATSKGGDVIAFDLETGVERWRVDVDGACVASPAVANGVVFVVTTTTTTALDVASGSTIWSVDRGGMATPTVVNETVYVAAQSPGRTGDEEWFEPTELAALSVVDGSTRWTVEADGVVDTTPAYADGTVYVGSEGGVMAVDATTGETAWTTSVGDDAPATTVTVDDAN